MSPRVGRLLIALAVASAGCAFLAMRVFVGFDPLRVKALQQPRSSTNDRVEVVVADDKLATLRTPFALIARIRNDAAESQELVVGVDGSSVCTATVRGRSAHRVDCAVVQGWSARSDHIVSIGGRAPWTLEYLELATHHGNSTGLLTAFVLPGGSRQFQRPRAVHLVLAWLALVVLLALPSRAFVSRLARTVSATGVALALLLVALLLLLPWFLPYLVVIAPGTFARLVLLATCSRTWPLIVKASPYVAAATQKALARTDRRRCESERCLHEGRAQGLGVGRGSSCLAGLCVGADGERRRRRARRASGRRR